MPSKTADINRSPLGGPNPLNPHLEPLTPEAYLAARALRTKRVRSYSVSCEEQLISVHEYADGGRALGRKHLIKTLPVHLGERCPLWFEKDILWLEFAPEFVEVVYTNAWSVAGIPWGFLDEMKDAGVVAYSKLLTGSPQTRNGAYLRRVFFRDGSGCGPTVASNDIMLGCECGSFANHEKEGK